MRENGETKMETVGLGTHEKLDLIIEILAQLTEQVEEQGLKLGELQEQVANISTPGVDWGTEGD